MNSSLNKLKSCRNSIQYMSSEYIIVLNTEGKRLPEICEEFVYNKKLVHKRRLGGEGG